MAAQHWAGVIRRHDGPLLPVLGCDDRDSLTFLHVQGAAVDFWATPGELYRRGYRLAAAKPAVWDLWSGVMCGGAEGRTGDRAGMIQ